MLSPERGFPHQEIGPRHLSTVEQVMASYTDRDFIRAQAGRLDPWYKAAQDREQTLFRVCSDTRLPLVAATSVIIGDLGGGGPIEPFIQMYKNDSINRIVVVSHFDGELLEPFSPDGSPRKVTVPPLGCGIINLLTDIQNGKTSHVKDTERYASSHVREADALLLPCSNAAKIARLSGRDTMAATIDHRTGQMLPIAVFTDNGHSVHSSVGLEYIFSSKYDVDSIYSPIVDDKEHIDTYKSRIPYLKDKRLGRFFEDILLHRQYVSELQVRHPDFYERQRVINARLLVLTTQKIPFRARNNYFDETKALMSIHLSRNRDENQQDNIDPYYRSTALDQTQYPIQHAADNFGKGENVPFSNLDTVLIETGSMDASKLIADELDQREWMPAWRERPGTKVLIAEIRRGVTQDIDEYVKTA